MLSRKQTITAYLHASTMLTSMVTIMALAHSAYALPVGGQVTAGQATITTTPQNMQVAQGTNRAVIDWQGFDIDAGEKVQFAQPSSQAVALNRVKNGSASQILGSLDANGTVMLVNPQGVVFGQDAQVNVGGLVATSSDIDNDRFMQGDYSFDRPGNPNAAIVNDGTITVKDGGLAALVGPNVINNGLIQAKLGKVQLASGDKFSVDLYGDGLINLQASPELNNQLVKNSGKIKADGGEVLLTAAAAKNTINSLINMDGLIQANSVGNKQGKVVLYGAGSNAVAKNIAANKGKATGNSTVLVSGTINAKGNNPGEKGGSVDVLGDRVAILSRGVVDASGQNGGGIVRIGGDYHGEGETPTALRTIIQSDSTILANAIENGDGGKVTVWADDHTDFAGNIEAKGGAFGGNGGFVETSGKQTLESIGSVYASAPLGNAGMWLLDPFDITIGNPATQNVTGSPNFTSTANNARVKDSDISAALTGGTSVTITTGGVSVQLGNISIGNNVSISKTGGSDATLTLNATNNISIGSNSTISSSTGKLNVVLNADSDASGAGGVTFNAGSSITSNNGNITVRGQSFTNNSGSGVFTVGTGRWLTYTVNPANDTLNGLASNFHRYSCSFGGSCPSFPGTGNGNLYSYTPLLTVTPNAVNITYGDAAPSLAGYGYGISGLVGSDTLADAAITGGPLNGTTTYTQGSNVGNYNINYSSGTLASAIGYGFTYANNASGLVVGAKTLTASLTGTVSKTYDQLLTATLNSGNYSLSGIYNGDAVSISNTSGSYDTKNVGTNKTVTVTGLALTGAKAGNYTLASSSVSGAVGTILQRVLTVSAAGIDKVYDATTAATVNLSNNKIAGDVVNNSYSAASFGDKNVANGKTVSVSGISIGGADAGNYSLSNTTASTTANITPRALTVSATGVNKVYDGTTTATVNLSDNRILGDVLSDNYTSASFANKNVGNGKTVSVTGISLSGTDAGNYSLSNTTATTTANITPRTLNVFATGVDKEYDGTTDADVTLSDDKIAGDHVNTDYTSAAFLDKHAGTNKEIDVSGISIKNGSDAGNYVLGNTTATAYADITPASLTITAKNQKQTYGDGNNFTEGFTSNGLVTGDVIDTVDFSTNAPLSGSNNWSASPNGNPWDITPSNPLGINFSAGDYDITYNTGKLTIDQRDLVVTSVAQDKTYDGTKDADITLLDDRISGDIFTASYNQGHFNNPNVGTNKNVIVNGISLSGPDADNYKPNNSANTQASITPASLTITANNQTMTYGDGNNLTAGFGVVGLIDGESVDAVDLSTNATFSGSGNWNATHGTPWTITATNATGSGGFDIGNYTIIYNPGTLTINPRALVVSATGIDKVYDGTTNASVTLSDNHIDGDDVASSYTTASFNDKNVGTDKNVSVSGINISGDDADNYTPNTTASATADITPLGLTVSANATGKIYGAADPALTFSHGALAAGDTDGIFSGSLTRTAGEHVLGSPYAITLGSLSAGGNYTIVFTGADFTISPYALSVIADNQTMTFGGLLPALTYTHGTLQNGDTDSIFSGSLATVAANSPVGSYDITQGTLAANSDYIISFTPGTLTIEASLSGINAILQQADDFMDKHPQAKKGPQNSTLLSMVTPPKTPKGFGQGVLPPVNGPFGNLEPAAGGNVGKIKPSAGGSTPGNAVTPIIECNSETPCEI